MMYLIQASIGTAGLGVSVLFVDIDGTVDHHCLNFLFLIIIKIVHGEN
jgi:hypothetical protein